MRKSLMNNLRCFKEEGRIVMNQSKTGLNDSFYKWIDQVDDLKRKLPELQEKLEYYKVKLIGYHGISYDQIGSGTSNKNGDENLLYWIDKINQVEKELEINNEVLRNYEDFKNSLKDELKDYHYSIC